MKKTRKELKPSVILHKDKKKMVTLYNLETGELFQFNETAGLMLDEKINGLTDEEIINKVMTDYDTDEDSIKSDLKELTEFLKSKKIFLENLK